MRIIHGRARYSPISSGTRKHLVDADDVVRVHANSHVEAVLASHLGDVLVRANSSSLESLRGELLELVRDEVDAGREVVYRRLLAAKIEDSDLGIRDTTAVARLNVRLAVDEAVATEGACRRK